MKMIVIHYKQKSRGDFFIVDITFRFSINIFHQELNKKKYTQDIETRYFDISGIESKCFTTV